MARVIHNYHCPICGEEVSGDWAVKHGYGAYAFSRTFKGIQTKSYIHTKCYEQIKRGNKSKGGDQNGASDVQP